MRENLDTLSPVNLLLGWLLALQSLLLTLMVAVIGQGLGAWIGGCSWVGISLPLDRQVWALVNYPNLAFAATSSANAYWLGSLLLPLGTSAVMILAFTRARTVNAELLVIHSAWAGAVYGAAWLPLLDPDDGHLALWLHYQDQSGALLWAAPVLGLAVALLATLRLLALSRISRSHAGRGRRLLVVMLHLCLSTAAVVAGFNLVHGELMLAPTMAVAAILAAALVLPWIGYAPAPVHTMHEARAADLLRTVVIVVLLAAMWWPAGRPLGQGRCAGVLWSRTSITNNIRQWIDARTVLGKRVVVQPPDSGGGG